jgi:hypothetical protein
MVCCNVCGVWFHPSCLGMMDCEASAMAIFICSTCQDEAVPSAPHQREDRVFGAVYTRANGATSKWMGPAPSSLLTRTLNCDRRMSEEYNMRSFVN